MGWLDGLKKKAEGWFLNVALKKASKRAVYALAGILVNAGVASLDGSNLIVNLDAATMAGAGGIIALFALIANFAKFKNKKK